MSKIDDRDKRKKTHTFGLMYCPRMAKYLRNCWTKVARFGSGLLCALINPTSAGIVEMSVTRKLSDIW